MANPEPQGRRSPINALTVFSALVLGAVIGGMVVEYWMVTHAVATPQAQAPGAALPGSAADDLAQLKKISPTQSHTMHDVGYHWANLWFAAEKKNWPLATYFFNEARQAMRWTMLVRPVRQLPGGGTVNIKGIFDAVDPSAFATVQIAIEDQDSAAFTAAYKTALTACQSCHASAGLPFLRPVVPTAPPTTILGFER